MAAAFRANFAELWDEGKVETTGDGRPGPADVGGVEVRAWFTPGQGRALSHRISAENVLEIRSAEHADAMAAFIDEVRAKYPAAR